MFGWLSDRFGRRTGMLTVFTLFTLAYGLVGIHLPAAWLYTSIALFFGMGQIIGPALAGFLADVSGTFRIAFGMCAAATLIAVILTFILPRPRT